MKRALLVGMLVMAPAITKARWLDDSVTAYNETGSFDREKSLKIIEEYQERDDAKRIELEKNAKKTDGTGFWGGVRDGSYKAELSLLRGRIDYYKKVERLIREFPENKKQQESFVQGIEKLSRYRKRLEEVRDRYRKSSGK